MNVVVLWTSQLCLLAEVFVKFFGLSFLLHLTPQAGFSVIQVFVKWVLIHLRTEKHSPNRQCQLYQNKNKKSICVRLIIFIKRAFFG